MTSPFHHHQRGSLSPQRRARLFAERGGKCAVCTRKLSPGDDWDVDHIHALERGGTDDDGNLQVICGWCHTTKTAEDHSEAGKLRRSYTRHVVPQRFRKRGWR